MRNLLFGPPGEGQDLAVLNIMRGREHGIPPLNDVREAIGLDRLADFSDLTGSADLAAKFAQVYSSIDEVDLWVGGLAEDKLEGSQLGATFHTIVLDQFMRLRDGDRLYFEQRLAETPDLLAQIKSTSFSDILQRNSDIDHLQDDAFIAHERIAGSGVADRIEGGKAADLMMGYDGADHLRGKQGDDDLYGGAGRDVLKGGKGDDVLNGGEGNDRMWGGQGDDIFVFDQGSGRDKVHRFDAARDRIDISDYGFRSYEELQAVGWQKGHKVILELDRDTGDQVQLVGVDIRQLGEYNFIFDDDDLPIV